MSESTVLLRVMTWNLWWRFGSWRTRLVGILAVLHAQRPDIIGLQEVWDDGRSNLAAKLSDDLGYFYSWSPAPNTDRWRGRPIEPGVKVGNAILSRWPITSEAQRRLPEGDIDEGRTALFASIDVRGVQVPFFTTQFNSAPDQSSLRCEQVSALASFVAEDRTNEFPAIVTGDLNAEPDPDEIRMLCGHKTSGAVPGWCLSMHGGMRIQAILDGPGTARTRTSKRRVSRRPASTTCSSGRRKAGARGASGASRLRAANRSTGSGRPTMQPSS
jgi:endonuclease/exonuclease/phosphatase family metal-dependent hydrolase